MKIAIVEWNDAEYLHREEIPHDMPLMKSVGYITKLKDKVIITHLLTPDTDVTNQIHTVIPIGCIKKIIWVDTKKSRK